MQTGIETRAQAVLRRFGMRAAERPGWDNWCSAAEAMAQRVTKHLEPGRRVLVRGASGSGKSLLMRALAARVDGVCIEAQPLGEEIAVDCVKGVELENALEVLARFGLGEVYAYLSPAAQLSTGQQYRLKLAMAVAALEAHGGGVLLADEFATQLDAVGAAVIARNLRRVVDGAPQMSCVVATCHEGIERALRPTVVVHCDFGDYAMEA